MPVGDRGYMYVCAVAELDSRMRLATGLSNAGDSALCCDTLQGAIRHYGTPQAFHSDQGSTYTANSHLGLPANHRIFPSITAAGHKDKAMAVRLIGTLKNEYLQKFDYEDGAELVAVLAKVTRLYNTERPHASLGYQNPANVYYGKAIIKRCDLLDLTVADFSSELGDDLDLP